MDVKNTNGILHNNIFRFAIATIAFLMIPLIGRWDWTGSDYIIVAVLLFGAGLVYETVSKKVRNKALVGVMVGVLLVLTCIELAVGIFNTPFAGS